MFERDLRLQARSKGVKFDSSGMTSLKDGSEVLAHSEQEVFDILGLDFIRQSRQRES